mmetsp:Transcript_1135/g.2612  ORF Transcript_1135/g.2612 Transcript_1135/m.2612 type:complete len:425 (+) Transcript_1135:202-1476(+)
MAAMPNDADHRPAPLDVRTIGLSPQYWSYTPLLIGDLNSLLLIDGVDCMVLRSSGVRTKVLPVQNVLLFGVITSIVKRANHNTAIVVDDGTGVIDVAYWDDHDSHDDSPQGGAFDLPPLLPEHQRLKRRKCGFRIGDSIEVMGKIKTLTAGEPASQLGIGAARCNCTREVVVKSICISTTDRWNAESLRWLTAIQFAKQADSMNIGAGGDVLSLCGDKIKSSVMMDGDMLVDRDFVVNRRCCQTPRNHRESFYYCHCEAKLEPLDPTLFFRGALIDLLLEMESKSDLACKSATEDCLDLIGLSESDQTTTPPLLFRYETVNKNEELSKIALDLVVSQNSTPDLVKTNVQRLFRRTFAALASNGLLCLFNQEEDIYLLLSRTRVVEPYLRWRRKQPDGYSLPHPFFINCIPRKRLVTISKHLEEK